MFKISAFSVETGRQTMSPLVDGVVHKKQTIKSNQNQNLFAQKTSNTDVASSDSS